MTSLTEAKDRHLLMARRVVATLGLWLVIAMVAAAALASSGRAADLPFSRIFAQIGQSIAWSTVSGQADIFFVVDTSGSMIVRAQGTKNRVTVTAESLQFLVSELDAAAVDYHMRVVGFHEFLDDQALELSQWTPMPASIRQRIAQFSPLGEERMLDVLMQTPNLLRHRPFADRHLVIVCDSPALTSWDAKAAVGELQERIRRRVLMDGIRVHIVGYPETFQRRLATDSGGVFIEMPPPPPAIARVPPPPPGRVLLDPEALTPSFVQIARHSLEIDGATSDQLVVLLAVDYSLSMQGRLRATMAGMMAFDAELRAAGVDPSYAIARFSQTRGLVASGVYGVDIVDGLDTLEDAWRLFRHPATGTEDVTEALVACAPWLKEHSPTIAIVVTDEPPRAFRANEDVIGVAVRESGARLYAIMPLRGDSRPQRGSLEALVAAAEESGGYALPMPDAAFTPSAHR